MPPIRVAIVLNSFSGHSGGSVLEAAVADKNRTRLESEFRPLKYKWEDNRALEQIPVKLLFLPKH
jgi:hypothetical protein